MIRYATITRRFQFDSAHLLPLHKGKCCRLHGHTYVLEISVEGRVNAEGMVLDFGDLKNKVRELIIDRYDHEYLNELGPFTELPPTAENIAMVIYDTLCANGLPISHLRLYETPDSWVDYKGGFQR